MGVESVAHSPAFALAPLTEGIVPTAWPGVSAVPAGHDLERLAIQGTGTTLTLRNHLSQLPADLFDAILIDCPPSLGPLTQNALAASTAVIIPISCEYYPLEGLVQLLGAVRQAAATNRALSVGGVLLTMYDPTLALTREVEAETRSKLSEPVFRSVIPRDVAVAEAPSHCRSVIDYAPRSAGARGYVSLGAECIERRLVK
jgi:chromosome partitioning protein